MSFKAVAWAVEQDKTTTSSQTLLLMILANFANENFMAYPSIETLSRLTRMDKRTVRKCLLELQKLELIFDTGNKYQKQIVVYHLNIYNTQSGIENDTSHDDKRGNNFDTPDKNVGGTILHQRGNNFVSQGVSFLHQRGNNFDTQSYYKPINKPINELVSINTHENTHEYEHQTFQNPQGLQQTKKTAKKTNVFIGVDELINLGVDEQVANDFLAIRKTKLTKTALNGIIKQSDLANISLAQALEFICEMGWQSFKAQWYFNSINSNKSDNSKSVISQLQEMANNNPTNIYIDDLPNGDYLGVTYE